MTDKGKAVLSITFEPEDHRNADKVIDLIKPLSLSVHKEEQYDMVMGNNGIPRKGNVWRLLVYATFNNIHEAEVARGRVSGR